MPPFGLYSLPRHHLYGGSPVAVAQRPLFNTMSFEGVDEAKDTPTLARIKEEGMGDEETKIKVKPGKDVLAPAAEGKNNSKSAKNSTPVKKRKRAVEVGSSNGNEAVIGPEWLQSLKTSVSDIGANFEKASQTRGDGQQFMKETKNKKKDKVKDQKKSESEDVKIKHKEATMSDDATDKKKRKKDLNEILTPVRRAANTPIPVPTSRNLSTKSRKQHGASDVLATETPPTQTSRVWKTIVPIPFALAPSSTALPKSGMPAPSSTPIPTPQASLTSSNLSLRYLAPLNDAPKLRPREGRASSVSSESSMSIKKAFVRVDKASTQTTANPFLSSSGSKKKKKMKKKKRHSEADLPSFTTAFHASQQAVNFGLEQEYLTKHISWRSTNDAAGPLPCLRTATGCTSKGEAALRTSISTCTPSKLTSTTNGPIIQFSAERAVSSSRTAELFLSHAIQTCIPVPVGTLNGVYTLSCPAYAVTHVDKYASGQRTLHISRPAGFTGSTYTARLTLPPRSMAFSILSFDVPPHASFRVTTVRTGVEGYTLDLVCLGNGYILLRLDLGLLLMGKKSEGVGVMEFVGVRERDGDGEEAVVFGGMSAGGVDGRDMVKMEVDDQKVKKKRGRPSNAEKERRAKESRRAAG